MTTKLSAGILPPVGASGLSRLTAPEIMAPLGMLGISYGPFRQMFAPDPDPAVEAQKQRTDHTLDVAGLGMVTASELPGALRMLRGR